MTDREKAFVFNGLRNHLRACSISEGDDPARHDQRLLKVFIGLGVPLSVVEETWVEQQALLALMMEISHEEEPHDV